MRFLYVAIALLLLSGSLQSQQISYRDRLYYTCRAWGLVKYHHSAVSNCEADWNAALIDALPAIKAAQDFDAFNDALFTMLREAGPMAVPIEPAPVIPAELQINRDFDWLQDGALRDDVRGVLDTVVQFFRPHEICFVDSIYGTGTYLTLPHDDPMLDVNAETRFPEEAQRLLSIFSYWNLLYYYNPNSHILDVPWESTLRENILTVAEAPDFAAYYDSYRRMAAALDDAHVDGHIRCSRDWTAVFSPQILIGSTADGYTVLMSEVPEVAVGDILLSLNGTSVEDIEDSLRQFISAGNEYIFRTLVARRILLGFPNTAVSMTFWNGADSYTHAQLRNFNMNKGWKWEYYPSDSLKDATWRMWEHDVGYVNMGWLQVDDVSRMYDAFRDTRAIIFDLRWNAYGTAPALADMMYPDSMLAINLIIPRFDFPGVFQTYPMAYGHKGNPTPYRGKVIILCNAETQSHGEWSAMILGAMPDAVIVGTPTAGADGNVTTFSLTRDITAGFTSLGVYWPDGRQTQRVGILPDSLVIPTREDIIRGRDPVLIRALQIAGVPVTVRTPPSPSAIVVERNYPNPFVTHSRMHVTFTRTAHARITLHDMLGRQVRLFADREWRAGRHTVTIDAAGLPAGSYICRVQTDGHVVSRIVTRY